MRQLPSDELSEWTRDWGQLLRSARQVAGLSLAGLSERTGLSRGYLSKLESGQDGARNPSRSTLVALARALPSFRPLAYQLEPNESAQQPVAFAQRHELSRPAHMLIGGAATPEAAPVAPPIQLGWRELEALVAYLALERSAAPIPITARLIARATDRTLAQTQRTLEQLSETGTLSARPPTRPGDLPTYGRGAAFEDRLGLATVGDALILAAALLAQAAPANSSSSRSESRDDGL